MLLPLWQKSHLHMQIIEVTAAATAKVWLELPFTLYKGDDNWIPPLRQDIEKVFDPKRNKAWQFGEAARWLLMDDNSTPIGRIAAFTNEKMSNPLDYPVGGVGFFECIDDQQAANLLFDTAKEWLTTRGMEGMDGPINFGEKNQFWGLLIDNFTDPPTYGFNYNPRYYQSLFENYGFRVFYNQNVYYRTLAREAEERMQRKARIIAERNNITARNVKGLSIDDIADRFVKVYNGAWATHEGFKPMKKEQADKIIHSMKAIMDPRIVIFAYHENEPIGFFVNIPELNQVFRYVHGNLNWWGKLKFLYHKKFNPPRTMYGLVFGVVKEWQGKGAEAAMIQYASDTIVANDWYEDLVMTWIGDFNPKMIHVIQQVGGDLYRQYATYRFNFDPNRPFQRHPVVGRKEDTKKADSAESASSSGAE